MIKTPVFLMNKSKEDIFGFEQDEEKLYETISPFMNLSEYVVVPVDEVIDPSLPLSDRAQKLVELGKISVADAVSYERASDTYSVTVEWGDWKHDHARLDLLFREVLGLYLIAKDVTEEDDSDTFSAVHKYSTYC